MAYTEELQAGRAGTIRTTQVMRSLVERGKRDPRLVLLARRVVQDVPERDTAGELGAVSSWVAGHVRFVRDPVGVEALADPSSVERNRNGDCDEQVTLAATLAECLGYRTRFRVGGEDEDRYRHVWAEALDRHSGEWYPLDPINRSRPAGWAAPFARTESYPLLGDAMEAIAIGSGGAPFGSPQTLFPRAREARRPIIGASFLELATTSMENARYSSTREPDEVDYDPEISGLGQVPGDATSGVNVDAIVQQWRSRRGQRWPPTQAQLPRPSIIALYRSGVRQGPGGEALPAPITGRGDNSWQLFRYELELKYAGWDFIPGQGWARAAGSAPIPTPPPLQTYSQTPPAPLATTPPPNYGYGAIPYPLSPTAQPQAPYYPQPTSPYPQQDYYQQPPPSFEQGRSFVTPTAEFAPFGPEINATPTGIVEDETAPKPAPAINPWLIAGALAAAWFFFRKKRGATAAAGA